MGKFCSKCGSPLRENEAFCANCGTPVTQTPAADTPAAGTPSHEDAYADLKERGVDWKQLKPKLTIGKPQVHVNKGALILFAVVVVIILIAALFK